MKPAKNCPACGTGLLLKNLYEGYYQCQKCRYKLIPPKSN